MRVSSIERNVGDGFCELHAVITSASLAKPFHVWFRVPAHLERTIDPFNGDPFVAAALLPAMKVGEPLEIDAAVSPMLARATTRIQVIYRCWEPRLLSIELRAPARAPRVTGGDEIGLFFSGGVDSAYSLTKNCIEHALNEDVITQLITIHGIDVRIHESRRFIIDQMQTNTREVANRLGKGAIEVATNVQDLLERFGIPFGKLGHGAALASVGLVLQQPFRKFYIAPGGGGYHCLLPAGSHPLLDPLWSTETSTFLHDGCEATRLERIRLLVEHPLILDKVHVCWHPDSHDYNCGKCSKCLLLMVGLHLAGAAGACPTLSASIDLETLRRVRLVIRSEVEWCAELAEALDLERRDPELRDVLIDIHTRARRYFERLDYAGNVLCKLIPRQASFVIVDGEAIREKLGVGTPFLERDGVYAGNPPDDAAAIEALERMRNEGADYIAFWCGEFWYLDYYAGFAQHLRKTYRCVWDDDTLIVFDLRADPAEAGVGVSAFTDAPAPMPWR